MRVLLVSFYTMEYVTRIDCSPPLALLYLASALRQAGHEPGILDLNVLEVPKGTDRQAFYIQTVLAAVGEVHPGMIGLNCLLSGHFPFVLMLSAALKEHHPSLPVVIGGIHPTLFAKEILQNCQTIDAIVMGEGEPQVVALADAYANEAPEALRTIDALAFRCADNQVVLNPRRGYIQNLDMIPLPAWDLVHMEDYFSDHSTWYNPRGLDIKMSVPILSSRSCPYDCSFCSAHYLMGRGLRLRSPKLVVDEMQMLYERYGMKYFGFVDDNLTLNKRHILAICNEIVRRNMVIQFESFNGYNLNSLDEEIVAAMVRAGCVYVILPIEHGCDHMRSEIIGKRLSRKKIFKVVEIYKRYNLLTRGVFIMGFPEDTQESLTETYNLILDLQLDMNIVFNLIPFPGTKIFDQAVRDGLFVNEIDADQLWDGTWDLNAVQNQFYLKPYQMSLEELAEFRKKFDSLQFLSERVRSLQKGNSCDENHD